MDGRETVQTWLEKYICTHLTIQIVTQQHTLKRRQSPKQMHNTFRAFLTYILCSYRHFEQTKFFLFPSFSPDLVMIVPWNAFKWINFRAFLKSFLTFQNLPQDPDSQNHYVLRTLKSREYITYLKLIWATCSNL